jgi:3-dehydroquinate dehydratase-2
LDQVTEHRARRLVLVLHGPNLNLLGVREPDIYGSTTLTEIDTLLRADADAAQVELEFVQSNYEGRLIEAIHQFGWEASGIIINPGAFTHYSIAIRDAIAAVPAPAVEVHLSNTAAREAFRHHSVIAPVARGTLAGFGYRGYLMALRYLIEELDTQRGN